MDISGLAQKKVEYFESYPNGSDSTTKGNGVVVGGYVANLNGSVHFLIVREFDGKIVDLDSMKYNFYLNKTP